MPWDDDDVTIRRLLPVEYRDNSAALVGHRVTLTCAPLSGRVIAITVVEEKPVKKADSV